jgi:hypothetical protein
LYLIFFPFSVSFGSGATLVEVVTSSLAAASSDPSLVLEGMDSERVFDAVAAVDVTDTLERADDEVSASKSSELGSGVGVGPTVDMYVSDEVEATSDTAEGVGEGTSTSASWNSVGDPCCCHEPSAPSLYQAPSSE